MMVVEKWINFNGVMVKVLGLVLLIIGVDYLVDFNHKGIEYRGLWRIEGCVFE